MILGVFLCGCTANSDPVNSSDDPAIITPNTSSEPGEISPEPITPIITPTPEPTPVRSNITDWDPYAVLPAWEPPINHTSINRDQSNQNTRQILNTSYSGSVGLAGFAVGKELNITSGPFSITYTVHPNVTSPRDVWVKITIFDPWQQVIAEGGYNRGFPNQETQEMTIYRTGRHYMSIEGEFARVDYTVKTTDIGPVITPTSAPAPEDMGPEGEGPY
nr:hypothetical protein [uncultured Methanospirillum sp.]